jgi:hypothetical protein
MMMKQENKNFGLATLNMDIIIQLAEYDLLKSMVMYLFCVEQ